MRQSHSEHTLQGSRNAHPPAVARPSDGEGGAAAVASRGPLEAGHASFFAADKEEESASGSDDEEAAPAAARRAKRAQQAHCFPRPLDAPVPTPSRPGLHRQRERQEHEAPPGATPSSNGSAPAAGPAAAAATAEQASAQPPASYYMPVVDRPSLLDMALSWDATPPPLVSAAGSELRPTHSLLDIEWSVSTPTAHAASPVVPLWQGLAMQPPGAAGGERPAASASTPAAAVQDDRPRNGWASLGETVSASLAETSSSLLAETGSSMLSAGSAASSLPAPQQPLPHQVSRAASAGDLARPIGSPTDPLAALDPFGGLGSWSSMDGKGSPGTAS